MMQLLTFPFHLQSYLLCSWHRNKFYFGRYQICLFLTQFYTSFQTSKSLPLNFVFTFSTKFNVLISIFTCQLPLIHQRIYRNYDKEIHFQSTSILSNTRTTKFFLGRTTLEQIFYVFHNLRDQCKQQFLQIQHRNEHVINA